MGSCFSERIGSKVKSGGLQMLVNPFGTVFNPVSLARLLSDAKSKSIDESLWVEDRDGIWYHHHYHRVMRAMSKASLIEQITQKQELLDTWLHDLDFLIVTLGTAFIYERNSVVISNCHKLPSTQFHKRLLTIPEIVSAIQQIQALVPKSCRIIWTVSPVRHTRDGLVGNQCSKASLVLALHQSIASQDDYFPAYEIMMDELRDYRFYESDLIHPNETAVNYIYQRFVAEALTEESLSMTLEMQKLIQATHHKPFIKESISHQVFLKQMIQKMKALKRQFSHLDITELENYFEDI